ncbi:MAG: ribosomal-processing cysteine protease Prp [Butyrivibrio sp.]|nr:ribosomal-processing cysteine protease Prp [Butyrivibrio sp.]
MTNIVFYRKAGQLIGFQSKGHAGYGVRGTDVVCASVSALIINTVNSVEKLTRDKCDSRINDRKAIIDFEIDGEAGPQSELLLKSLELGLKEISAAYPGNVLIKYRDF